MTTSKTLIDAEGTRISDLLLNRRFVVPWHQRYYDWDDENVQELLNDIKEAMEDKRKCYFLGAIILVELEDEKWEINDGQQRMITVSLLLSALSRHFAWKSSDAQREGLALRMVFDQSSDNICVLSESEKYAPRIETPVNDRVQYHQLIRGHTIGTNGKMTIAWQIIEEFLESFDSNDLLNNYFDYIRRHLEVACLQVPSEIGSNAVFETINCRGKP